MPSIAPTYPHALILPLGDIPGEVACHMISGFLYTSMPENPVCVSEMIIERQAQSIRCLVVLTGQPLSVEAASFLDLVISQVGSPIPINKDELDLVRQSCAMAEVNDRGECTWTGVFN